MTEANPQLELAIMEFERQIRIGEKALKTKLTEQDKELVTNYVTELKDMVALFNKYQESGRLRRSAYVLKITRKVAGLKRKFKKYNEDLERISKGVGE